MKFLVTILFWMFSIVTAQAKPAKPFYGSIDGGRQFFSGFGWNRYDGPLFSSDGTRIDLGYFATLSMNVGYFVSDHVAIEMGFGGLSLIRASLDDRVLGPAVQWKSQLGAKYFFTTPSARLHPFVGIGLALDHTVWEPDFNMAVDSTLDNVSVSSPYLTPVVTAGAAYNFGSHWFAGLSVDMRYLSAHFDVKDRLSPPDDKAITKTNSVDLGTILLQPSIKLGYRF